MSKTDNFTPRPIYFPSRSDAGATRWRSTRRPPRLRAYLEAAGHAGDSDGPMFRPLKHNGKQQEERQRTDPDAIDRVVRKYASALGLRSWLLGPLNARHLHTTALENGKGSSRAVT